MCDIVVKKIILLTWVNVRPIGDYNGEYFWFQGSVGPSGHNVTASATNTELSGGITGISMIADDMRSKCRCTDGSYDTRRKTMSHID